MISVTKRAVIGVCMFLFVNILWVLSLELTNYIFIIDTFKKPFFTTYVKGSMFSFLLFGFICSTHWKMLAFPQRYDNSTSYDELRSESNDNQHDEINILSESSYVLVNFDSSDDESKLNSEDDYVLVNHKEMDETQKSTESSKRTVKFCKYKEIRHISDTYAEESLVARMSYKASKLLRKRIMIQKIIDQGYFPASFVMKFAAQSCFLWMLANYGYQKSITKEMPAAFNVISSASSLFTFFLAALFPGSIKDKFSTTKLLIVLLSTSGIIIINFAEFSDNPKFHYEGIIWSLIGGASYAAYLVNIRRRFKSEQQISIIMFLGFVGFWILVTLWPTFFFLNYANFESFQWPNLSQLSCILVGGLFSTVVAELLWIWACFLTSSLTATLSMTLAIPLTMAVDYILDRKVYDWMVYLGNIPIIVSFVLFVCLTSGTGPSPDPLGHVIGRILCLKSSKPHYSPISDNDPDTSNDGDSSGDVSRDGSVQDKSCRLLYRGWLSVCRRPRKAGDDSQLLINDIPDDDDVISDD